MTHFFQSVNKSAKVFTKHNFLNYLQEELKKALEDGEDLDNIEIQYQLSVLKSIHDRQLVNLYNYMATEKGKQKIMNGWQHSEILDTIQLGTQNLPLLDLSHDISLMSNDVTTFPETNRFGLDPAELESYKRVAQENPKRKSG